MPSREETAEGTVLIMKDKCCKKPRDKINGGVFYCWDTLGCEWPPKQRCQLWDGLDCRRQVKAQHSGNVLHRYTYTDGLEILGFLSTELHSQWIHDFLSEDDTKHSEADYDTFSVNIQKWPRPIQSNPSLMTTYTTTEHLPISSSGEKERGKITLPGLNTQSRYYTV